MKFCVLLNLLRIAVLTCIIRVTQLMVFIEDLKHSYSQIAFTLLVQNELSVLPVFLVLNSSPLASNLKQCYWLKCIKKLYSSISHLCIVNGQHTHNTTLLLSLGTFLCLLVKGIIIIGVWVCSGIFNIKIKTVCCFEVEHVMAYVEIVTIKYF